VKLTEKQKAFCDYYIESLNATESYKRAYGCNNDATARTEGSKNLAKPNIKNYIDERMKEIEDKRIAKAEEVLEYLTKVIRNEEKEEVVVTVNVGDFQTEIKKVKKELSAKDKIKAAELLGKRYRLFTDKVEADVNQVVVFTGEDDLED
jgi:phage terminase small subunit